MRGPLAGSWLSAGLIGGRAGVEGLDHELRYDHFAEIQPRFVQRLLRAGMTMLSAAGMSHQPRTKVSAARIMWRSRRTRHRISKLTG
jgi:hypothetical protein